RTEIGWIGLVRLEIDFSRISVINDNSAGIKDQLEISVDEIKPLLVAEQFSKHNHAPSSISTQGASSKNEVLIAQIVQVRLGDQYVTYVAAMEQIRTLTR
ncbi:unnamed protein product, partial [Rotaria magnacalcarata]